MMYTHIAVFPSDSSYLVVKRSPAEHSGGHQVYVVV